MGCKSCLEKAYLKYRGYGFSHDEAVYMAKKLMRRVEKRRRKERIRFFYRNINRFMWKWIRLCNWKATFLWTVKNFRFIWIGKSYNPDYTQTCINGTCASSALTCTKHDWECESSSECVGGTCSVSGSCGCPAPSIAHSSQSSACSVLCLTTGRCDIYTGTCTPTCYHTNCLLGTCGYTCDSGYVWNGVACVASGVLIQLPKVGVGL